MQRVVARFGERYGFLDLPDPEEYVVPGVAWGRFEHPLTAAFWSSQAWMAGEPEPATFRLGRTLAEELAACLLGGHGAPAEVGLAAYGRIRDALAQRGDGRLPAEVAERLLTEPLDVDGRRVRYRFARQRARHLAGALDGLQHIDADALADVALRDALRALPGIGPKTASWIVRNRRGSDAVAILDVHIVRACRVMGVFPDDADPGRGYVALERRFLAFCEAARARASVMDATMWVTMRGISPRLYNRIVDPRHRFADKRRATKGGERECRAAAADVTRAQPPRAAHRRGTRACGSDAGRSTAPKPA